MKKIVAAWIEQILEFPTKLEYLAYIESLKKGKPHDLLQPCYFRQQFRKVDGRTGNQVCMHLGEQADCRR